MEKNVGIVSTEEAIKAMMYTFSILHYCGESVESILLMSVENLQELYRLTGKRHFVEMAEWELLAYLSMGFHVPQNPMIEQFIQVRNIREKAQRTKCGKRVEANRSQVRAMIGKWMPSRAMPITIGQVVDDIIEKVKIGKPGTWQYTYRRADSGKNDIGGEERYELVITDKESFFWDLKNYRFYIFEGSGKVDTDSDIR